MDTAEKKRITMAALKDALDTWCDTVGTEMMTLLEREPMCLELLTACQAPASPEADAKIAETARRYMTAKARHLAAQSNRDNAQKITSDLWKAWALLEAGLK